MNSRILNKVVVQSLRYSHCRYMSVQQNINKCSSTCHTLNFHRRKENRSSSFIFTKFSNDRNLYQSTLPIYTCFQRNLSGTSQLSQAANGEPVTKLADAASPIANVTQNLDTSSILLDISESPYVEFIQQLLVQMHESTGLPWWASIALTTCLFRTCIVLPFSVTQLRLMAKLEKVSLAMEDTKKKLKKEAIRARKEFGWPQDLAEHKYEEATDKAYWYLVNKDKCHPGRLYFLIFAQVSLYVTFTAATFTLCDARCVGPNIYNQLTTGGFGWVTDLTVIDPYLILPISLALINLCILEVHQSFKVIRNSKYDAWNRLFFRTVSIGLIPVAAYVPAAVNIYWLSSSLYGFLQAFLLNSSPMRRLFRVPMNDPALKQPYRYFLQNTKERLKLSKGKGVTAVATK